MKSVREQMWGRVEVLAWGRVWDPVGNPVGNQVWSPVRDLVVDQVRRSL